MDGIPLTASYTWAEATALGVTRAQIAADGVAIARGLYVSRAVDLDLAARCRAWARVLPADAVFGLHTAAALSGAPTLADTVLHVVLRPRPVLPQRSGVTVHTRALQDDDVVAVDGIRVTSGAQTYLDMAAVLSPVDLVVLGDALMRTGRLTREALRRRLARAARVRGMTRARTWADRLTESAGSPPESWLRYQLMVSDLPDPEVQVPIHDGRGREVAHADLGYSRWRVALEYEVGSTRSVSGSARTSTATR